MRRMYALLVAALLALIMSGCGTNSNSTDVPDAALESPFASSPGAMTTPSASNEGLTPSTNPAPSKSAEPQLSNDPQAQLKDTAQEVIEFLRERDLKSLAQWIDPEQGLRFSPYSHINIETDLVFKADQLPAFKDTNKLKWGFADGSGDPIELSFRDYYEKFVYNQDFEDAPNVNVNKIMGLGNAEFNGKEVYPDASFVEYHFPGFDDKYEGMDWQSLILVFVPAGNEWKLVAIVHGQWTI